MEAPLRKNKKEKQDIKQKEESPKNNTSRVGGSKLEWLFSVWKNNKKSRKCFFLFNCSVQKKSAFFVFGWKTNQESYFCGFGGEGLISSSLQAKRGIFKQKKKKRIKQKEESKKNNTSRHKTQNVSHTKVSLFFSCHLLFFFR